MAKKRKKKAGWKSQLGLIALLMMSVVFSSIAVVIAIGMIPTMVCAIVDRSKGHVKTLTVGLMNLAGCMPFVMEVWKKGGSFEVAMNYIFQPRTILVMFFAAGMGYLIDWALTGIVSSVMVQRAKGRMNDIQNHQKELVERWGPEVSGNMPLDEYGFPRESFAPTETAKQE